MSQKAVCAYIIPNSAVGIFSQKQKGHKVKSSLGTDMVVVASKFRSLYFANLATLKSRNSYIDNLLKDTAETESEVAEKSSWDQANRGQELGLVWRNRN
jgi:hypothetical protein